MFNKEETYFYYVLDNNDKIVEIFDYLVNAEYYIALNGGTIIKGYRLNVY